MLQMVLLAGKFVLLIILYLFIMTVVRSSTQELRRAGVDARQPSGWRYQSASAQAPLGAAPVHMPVTGADHTSNAAHSLAHGTTMWRLIVIKSPFLRTGETFAFPLGASAVVGRTPEMDIFLDDTFVSSKHALFEAVDGLFRVEDLHSTNGTMLNGQEVVGIQGLRVGDQVEIGDTIFQVEVA